MSEYANEIIALEKELAAGIAENAVGPVVGLAATLLEDYVPDVADVAEATGMVTWAVSEVEKGRRVVSSQWLERAKQCLAHIEPAYQRTRHE